MPEDPLSSDLSVVFEEAQMEIPEESLTMSSVSAPNAGAGVRGIPGDLTHANNNRHARQFCNTFTRIQTEDIVVNIEAETHDGRLDSFKLGIHLREVMVKFFSYIRIYYYLDVWWHS